MPDDPDFILLELKPVADPQCRHGHPARDVRHRLKKLLRYALRAQGFRVRWGRADARVELKVYEPEEE